MLVPSTENKPKRLPYQWDDEKGYAMSCGVCFFCALPGTFVAAIVTYLTLCIQGKNCDKGWDGEKYDGSSSSDRELQYQDMIVKAVAVITCMILMFSGFCLIGCHQSPRAREWLSKINEMCKTSFNYILTHKPQAIGFTLTAASLITLSALLIPETESHKAHIVVIAALGILACSVAAGAAAKKATQTFFHRRHFSTLLRTDVDIEAAVPLISPFSFKTKNSYGT